MSNKSDYVILGIEEASKSKWNLFLSPHDAISIVKRAEAAESERDNLRAILDGMAVKGIMDGESGIECLQRQLAALTEENERLSFELICKTEKIAELTRYSKMDMMVHDFSDAKETLEGIVETLGAYIKAASDE